MRTSKVKGRKTGASTYNVQTTYTYQYKNGSNPRSYVKTLTTFTDMTSSGSAFKDKTIWQYMDGLGRPVQTVDQKHSPSQKDVVVTTEYDNQGRQSKVYNPFEQNQTTGAFVASVPTGTPFTLTQYYSDPLNRTWKVTPPSWYATTYSYGANVASNVKLNHTTSTFYAANLLFLTTVTDPNGNQSATFKDKKGRLVLSRRFNAGGSTTYADTYNLYDNKDRLVKVLPPGVGVAVADTNLIFNYRYDQADNMTFKNVPDAAPINMKYDTRNLMTLMQDGNLLAYPNRWLATNYDVYGRPVATGFKTATSPLPDSTFSFSTLNKLTETTYDDVSGGQAIYKGKVKQSQVKVMDAANTSFITTNYAYDAHGRVSGTTANNFTTGTDNYAFTYDWADNRLTSTRTHKRLSTDAATTVLETTTYDHAGRLKENKHQLNGGSTVTLSQLNYNHKDQLIEKNLGVGTSTKLQSIDYWYNAQGWLRAINQPDLTTTGTPVTLASCTAPAPNATESENDLFYLELRYDTLFSGTSGGISSMGGTAQFNGNIAQMAWRTRGRDRQAYHFTYDLYDRLTGAYYYDVNNTGTATATNNFNEVITYADKRGNIGSLTRQGATAATACTFAQIDNLAYSYTSGTNKLNTITDAASATYKARGFNPGGGSGSYVYDVNGNLTTDPYKAMTVQYNHLNLPKKMTFGNDYIEITYDAAGTKLRKVAGNNAILTGGGGTEKSMNGKDGEKGKDDNAPEAAASAGPPTNYYTHDYLGGIEYRDGVREAIYTAEGRLFNNAGTNRYEYTIKDHLGNARISFTDKNGNNTIEYSNGEVLQENHYYPFGLNTDGPWMNDAALDNKYQYNGKEFNDDFGLNLNDYGARWYDASVGRWWSVDPMSDDDKLVGWSPYNYVLGNPMNKIDPDGQFPIETFWDVGNLIYDTGKAIYHHAKGEHDQAKSSWVDAASDLAATLIPYVPAGASKALKAADKAIDTRKAADKATDANKLAKAGDKNSTISSTSGAKVDTKTGQKLGPSGKPMVHTVEKSSKKEAKDAARNDVANGSKGTPVKHTKDEKGGNHYHNGSGVQGKGKDTKDYGSKSGKVSNNVHYNYPKNGQ
jgi:RHS repeat-associated protein